MDSLVSMAQTKLSAPSRAVGRHWNMFDKRHIERMRELLAAGVRAPAIARRFDCDQATIRRLTRIVIDN